MNSVTRHQAAVMLGVTDQTISNYCKEGLLTYYKGKGNILYIDADELEKYKSQIKVVKLSEERLRMKQEQLADEIAKVDAADQELRGALLAHKPKEESLAKVIEKLYTACYFPKMGRRECTFIQKYIQGVSMRDLALEFDLSFARVQQIITKAIRRFDDFSEVEASLFDNYGLRRQIQDLLLENDMLKKQIAELKKEEEFCPSEYLTTLLNSRIADYGISVRAYGILKNFRDDGMNGNHIPMITIGDLVMRSGGKINILHQRCCGKKTLSELDDLVDRLGLGFKYQDESEVEYYKRMQRKIEENK